MYIERIPNRGSPPAILLRESYREDGKVKKRTIANLSVLSPEVIELIRGALKGQKFVPADLGFAIQNPLPHGHVAAVIGTMKNLGVAKLLGRPCRERDLVMAMIVSRILNPASKLATSRYWETSTLADIFDVRDTPKDEIYAALDWLLGRQNAIEKQLAKRHLKDGSLVLFDLTSTYVEGRKCPLAKHGYSRDHRSDLMQVEFGLLTDSEGRPIAVEVFEGNVSDSATVSNQVLKLKENFGLADVVIVGDRGMITTVNIKEHLKPNQLSWIGALRHNSIRKLAEGPLQLSLFDEQNFAEIESSDYPGERLIACRNPTLATETSRKRNILLGLTREGLDKIQKSVGEGKLRKCDAIGRKVSEILKKYKMGKFFKVEISDDLFKFKQLDGKIQDEEALDGIYVLRTDLSDETMSSADTIRQYKDLSKVERAFRSIKTDNLHVRPIFHHRGDRVRAHIFLCMLAYYVLWEMRQRLAPLLFADENSPKQEDPVATAEPSDNAKRKTGTRRSATDQPLHSFHSLMKSLATLTRNWIQPFPKSTKSEPFHMLADTTPFQQEAFRLLGVNP